MRFKSKKELIFYFLKGSKRYFGLAIIFACLLSVFEMVNPKIIGYTVDSIIGTQENVFVNALGGRDNLASHLYVVAIVVIAFAIIGALCRYLFGKFNSMGAERLVLTMRNSLYEHILSLPYSWHQLNATGDIIQRCTSDVETVKKFLSEQLTSFFRTIIMVIVALSFMASISPLLTIIAAVFFPVVVLYSSLFYRKMGDTFQLTDEEEGKLSTIAQENLTGVRVVRAFGREKYEQQRFEKKNEEYTILWVRLMKLLSAFWTSNDILYALQLLTVVGGGAYLCVNGGMTAGEYIAFVAYNSMLAWPIRSLGRIISEMSKASISIDRLMYILNSRPEKDSVAPHSFVNGDIEIKNVSYSFDESSKVLDNVSLTIKQGQTIGILGTIGSGKSTLAHLLCRLYELDEGCGNIYIGGEDIKNVDRFELRRNVGMVLQEPYLFSRTLGENIAIGLENATIDDIRRAAEIACLDETVMGFKDGYDTAVGERGVTLSGGQKQRCAIAQMMIRNCPIIIFDDSLSAVDAQTDTMIREAILRDTKDVTTIIISHRISTIMQADNIFVLENGHLVQSGTHDKLVGSEGIYQRVYKLQSRT